MEWKCDKISYETKKGAKDAANGLQDRKRGKEHISFYQCPECKKYHLTSSKKSKH